MFDLSFFEIIVIGVVALVVIGPEKLPKVARTLGALTGRAQRYVAQVKEEVNREVRFSELQNLQSEIQSGVDKAQMSLRQQFTEVKASVENSAQFESADQPISEHSDEVVREEGHQYEDELVQPIKLTPSSVDNSANKAEQKSKKNTVKDS